MMLFMSDSPAAEVAQQLNAKWHHLNDHVDGPGIVPLVAIERPKGVMIFAPNPLTGGMKGRIVPFDHPLVGQTLPEERRALLSLQS